MTIAASEPEKITVLGNGSATVFSFAPMTIFQASDMTVTRVIIATGAETLLVQGSGSNEYLVTTPVTFDGSATTGAITFPSIGDPLPLGESLVMKPVLPIEQQTDLENQGGYFPETQETQFDKNLKVSKQQQEILDRSMALPISVTGVSVELPIPIADRFLGWDSTATKIENKATIPGTVTTTTFSESFLDDSNAEEGRDTIMGGSVKGDIIVGDGTPGSALLPVSVTDGEVLTVDSAAPLGVSYKGIIPAGTKMLFQQTTAPTGWTKDVVHNDKALRVVTGAAASGGSSAFSAVFPQATTGSHVLTTAELPSHKHFVCNPDFAAFGLTGANQVTVTGSFGGSADYLLSGTATAASLGLTGGTGSDTGHTHTLSMDLQFVDLIIATKD